ncbi:helix-hairpin-helix domain-containing protein [Pedobacter steynii]
MWLDIFMCTTTRIFCTFVLSLSFFNVKAQEDSLIKDIIESFAENLSDDYDLSELTERLTYYRKHPIDLNQTKPEELKDLIFLSPLQISNFFNHLKINGKLLDILELQGIEGFDLQTITNLMLFAIAKAPLPISEMSYKELVKKGQNDLIFRYGRLIQTQKGFKDLPGSRYLGTPDKLLLRYRYTYSNTLSASLVAEKDAGEHLTNNKTGVDHLSGNVAFYKLGRVKKLVLGDYSLQFGQGLALWSGFAFGKGPDVTSVASKDLGLRPYSSSNEASFFRGIAGTVNLAQNIDINTFISLRQRDASLKTSDGRTTLQNIGISGLHRTKTELKNQRSLEQFIYGGVLQCTTNNLNLGLVAYQSAYQHEFVTGNALYNKYAFTGKKLTNTGFHYSYTFKNIYFYGETAHSLTTGWAVVNGAMASLSKQVSAVLLHRNYDKDYHSFFSNGVGEGTEINNEKGWYAGLNYAPSKQWTFSVYGDYFKFPWLKYRVDSASSGYETLGQVAYTPTKTFKALARYKREIKPQNANAGSNYPYLLDVSKENYRIECNWQLNKKLGFQQRAELVHYKKGTIDEVGYLVYQDINYRPLSSKLTGNIRLAYFNTPSYNSRVYAYEDDVLYGSGFGVYSGKGTRTFANIRWRVLRKMDVWGRYAIFLYKDVDKIGSGLDEIEGNKKSDFKIQVRYQF